MKKIFPQISSPLKQKEVTIWKHNFWSSTQLNYWYRVKIIQDKDILVIEEYSKTGTFNNNNKSS